MLRFAIASLLLATLLPSCGRTSSGSDAEVTSITADKVEGDTAYVNVESQVAGRKSFERVVLKRISGRWRVAGKQ